MAKKETTAKKPAAKKVEKEEIKKAIFKVKA